MGQAKQGFVSFQDLPASTSQEVSFDALGGGATKTPQPAPVRPVNVGGRGTGLDVRKSDEFGQGVLSAVPIIGPDMPTTGRGVAGRAAGEAYLLAAPAVKGIGKAVEALPSAERAGKGFQEVMGVAKDLPVPTEGWGDAALRVKQLAERGGTLPKPVNDLLKRATDPAKADITYQEMRDFYNNISRLSADEWGRLTRPMKKAIGDLRASLNTALTQTAASVGKGDLYSSAMKEFRNASRLREGAEAVKDFAVKKLFPAGAAGAAGAYGAKKVYDAVRDH